MQLIPQSLDLNQIIQAAFRCHITEFDIEFQTILIFEE